MKTANVCFWHKADIGRCVHCDLGHFPGARLPYLSRPTTFTAREVLRAVTC
jgi:hypothetical protein